MEAVSIFETSVRFYQATRRNIPEHIFMSASVRTWNLTMSLTRWCKTHLSPFITQYVIHDNRFCVFNDTFLYILCITHTFSCRTCVMRALSQLVQSGFILIPSTSRRQWKPGGGLLSVRADTMILYKTSYLTCTLIPRLSLERLPQVW